MTTNIATHFSIYIYRTFFAASMVARKRIVVFTISSLLVLFSVIPSGASVANACGEQVTDETAAGFCIGLLDSKPDYEFTCNHAFAHALIEWRVPTGEYGFVEASGGMNTVIGPAEAGDSDEGGSPQTITAEVFVLGPSHPINGWSSASVSWKLEDGEWETAGCEEGSIVDLPL